MIDKQGRRDGVGVRKEMISEVGPQLADNMLREIAVPSWESVGCIVVCCLEAGNLTSKVALIRDLLMEFIYFKP